MMKARSARTSQSAVTAASRESQSKQKNDDRPADFYRLPKRFKDYISKLESRMRALESSAVSQVETNTLIKTYGTGDVKRYLPDSVEIRFNVSGRHQSAIDVKRTRDDDGMLEIYGESSLMIQPEVSNVFRVGCVRR
jgi:hypothetical protein